MVDSSLANFDVSLIVITSLILAELQLETAVNLILAISIYLLSRSTGHERLIVKTTSRKIQDGRSQERKVWTHCILLSGGCGQTRRSGLRNEIVAGVSRGLLQE